MDEKVSKECQKSSELIAEIYNCWEFARLDEETNTEYRKPMSKEQMDKTKKLLKELKKIDCDDEWVRNTTKEYQDVYNYQNKREFRGKKIVPLLIIFYAVIAYLLPNLYFLNPDAAKVKFESGLEKRIKFKQSWIQNQSSAINKINRNYNKYKSITEAEKDEKIALKEKSIKEAQLDIEELKTTEFSASENTMKLFVNSIVGFVLLFTGLFFKKAFSPPQFLRDKRTKERKEQTEVSGFGAFVKRMISGLFFRFTDIFANQGALINVKTTFGDGSSKFSSMVNPIAIIVAAFTIGIMITIGVYAALLAPIFVVYNYLKNYKWYR